MDLSSLDLPRAVFKRVIMADRGSISLGGEMIRLLAAIDETKNVSQVAREVGMDLATLRNALSKLLQAGLIMPVKEEVSLVGAGFIESLRRNLAVALGPMAVIIIEDTLAEMSLSLNEIPAHRAAELVSYLAREIPEDDRRVEFQKSMLKVIPK